MVCFGKNKSSEKKEEKRVEKKNIVWSLKKKQVKPSQKTGTCEKWSEIRVKGKNDIFWSGLNKRIIWV